MNKTKLTLISALAFLGISLCGCKENNTPIDFSRYTVGDTTYLLAAGTFPTSVDHNVLVEEFTGPNCANCPDAASKLVTIEGAHPGRVNVLSLFPSSSTFCRPLPGYTYDFRSATAEDIAKQIYADRVGSYPAGGIDRVPVSGEMAMGRSLWDATVTNRLTPCRISIDLKTSYNAAAGKDTIVAKVTYLDSTSVPGTLTIAIVEDEMHDKQESGISIIDDYTFMNVVRETVTPYNGTPLGIDRPLKEAGRVYKKVFVYKPKTLAAPNPPINPLNCRVIAFVHGIGPDYTIVQSAQTPLRH